MRCLSGVPRSRRSRTVAAMAYGTRVATWPPKAPPLDRQMVVAFRGRHVGRDDHTAAILLYRQDGATFPAYKDLNERKTHLIGGSEESWLWPGTSDDLKAAQALLACEGPGDTLAAASSPDLFEGMLAITNACGAKSTKLDYSIGAGKLRPRLWRRGQTRPRRGNRQSRRVLPSRGPRGPARHTALRSDRKSRQRPSRLFGGRWRPV